MSKPARPHGTIPAAFSATGRDVPPSPDVAERTLAEVIGETVALHLAPMVSRMRASRPACIVCAAKVKRAEQAWERDAAIRRAAAEPVPNPPDLGITESFTDGARGPVCWGCYDPETDGPLDFADILPPPVD